MNKTKEIMLHLQEMGHINTWEAITLYGATRLSSIIYNLRHQYDMNIVSVRKEFTDRYGAKGYFVDYVLEKEL